MATESTQAIIFKTTDDDGDIFMLDQSTIPPTKDIDGEVYLAQIITEGKEMVAVRLTKDDLCALQERLTEWRHG